MKMKNIVMIAALIFSFNGVAKEIPDGEKREVKQQEKLGENRDIAITDPESTHCSASIKSKKELDRELSADEEGQDSDSATLKQ